MDMRMQAEQLAQRPYLLMTSVEESTDDEPIYFARVLEMDGCFGQGDTREEAIEDLQLAMIDFIESLIEDGLYVPEPSKLVNTTISTGSKTTISFVGQGNRLKPKRSEMYRDSYLLSSHRN
ncbi:MAG TPA: type II toxin-antitoxin system HicB family antitoxin [Anaerolineales bacterium]|nr:type II toxin-antitoxin system HicB family antitoxin [Anaerolineales bacterium]